MDTTSAFTVLLQMKLNEIEYLCNFYWYRVHSEYLIV